MRSFLVAILSLAVLLSSLRAEPAPVRRVVLDNGLTILLREDHSAPVVSVQAWCRAGSIHEDRWLGAGLSHVLEHMLFKGTTTRGVAQIAQAIEAKGGAINAYTSFDRTVYYIDLPAAHWQIAVDILADCMMNATIPADELAKEKEVIVREMDMNRDDPDRRADVALWRTAYTTHPYRHPVIGYREIYDRVTRADVVAYYRQFYVPNNLTFVVVGAIEAAAVEARLRELTRDFRRAPLPAVYIPAEPAQLAPREHHEEMPVQLTQFHVAWHIPAFGHADMYPLDVLAIIAGGGRSSRLYRELRQKRGLVHEISAGSYTPAQPGLFVVSASADPAQRMAAIAAAQAEVERFRTEPVSDAELQKAIKQTVAGHYARLKTMSGQASDLASHDMLTGDPNFSDRYVERLRQVRAEDLRRVAQTYFTNVNMTVVSLNPPGALRQATAPRAAVAQPVTRKIELPNGLRLLVREDRKLPFVEFRAMLQGGVLAETPANSGITKLMARMLLQGTRQRSADDVAAELESVGGAISYQAGNNSFGLAARVMGEDLDRALDLLADVLQNPAFPEAALERERAAQLAELKAEDDQIFRVAQRLLRESLYAAHPYRLNVAGRADAVAKLTRADLVEFHRRYVVPGNLVLAVFGDVDSAELERKVAARFGKLPAVRAELVSAQPERLTASVRQEETRPREQAVLLLGFSGADLRNPDRYALEVLSEMYSGMGSRLFLRLREELGLCYYVGAYQLLGVQPGYFVFYVGTTAANVAQCEAEFAAELKRLTTDGITEEELERAKAGLIGQRLVQWQDNGERALSAALDELYGLGHDFSESLDEKYRAVTLADVQRVARQYFQDRPHAVVVVKPADKE